MKRTMLLILLLSTYGLNASPYKEKIAEYYDLKHDAINTTEKNILYGNDETKRAIYKYYGQKFMELYTNLKKSDSVESILKELCMNQYKVYSFTSDNMISKIKKDIRSRTKMIEDAQKEIELLEIELIDTAEWEDSK